MVDSETQLDWARTWDARSRTTKSTQDPAPDIEHIMRNKILDRLATDLDRPEDLPLLEDAYTRFEYAPVKDAAEQYLRNSFDAETASEDDTAYLMDASSWLDTAPVTAAIDTYREAHPESGVDTYLQRFLKLHDALDEPPREDPYQHAVAQYDAL